MSAILKAFAATGLYASSAKNSAVTVLLLFKVEFTCIQVEYKQYHVFKKYSAVSSFIKTDSALFKNRCGAR